MKTGPLPAGFFEDFLAQSFEPQCDDVAAVLSEHDLYTKARALPSWRRLLRECAMGNFVAGFQSKHVVIPTTFEEMPIAERELFVARVRRQGRDAYPDFAARIAWLRKTGCGEYADRASNAAANFRSYPPKGESGERFLRICLPSLWLPACLWMLCDGDIEVALPLLTNREGIRILADWRGIGSVERQDIGNARRSLKLPNAEGLVRAPCADIDHATGRLRIRACQELLEQ